MRLRERELLKAPERYGAEDWVATSAFSDRVGSPTHDAKMGGEPPYSSRIPLAARPTAGPPPYVDYNPNSPPAAFPTLDCPYPASMPSSSLINEPSTSVVDYNDFQNEPLSDIESSEEEENNERQDDHSVDVEDYKYLQAPDHVDWKDLSPVIQMEIINNLTQTYTWPRIVAMLQLSAAEQEVALESPSRRRRQAREEAENLGEMQAKQLRALLRIDNSVLRRSRVPAQLVFRHISKQYYKKAARNCSSVDPLMIKASELLAARRFLRGLGIDTQYAGEWRNDLVAINQTSDTNGEDEFQWLLDRAAEERNESDEQVGTSSPQASWQRSDRTTSSDARFLNRLDGSRGDTINTMYPVTPLNAARQIFGRRKSAQKERNTLPNRVSSPKSWDPFVRLRVGPEGAAQIQSSILAQHPSSPQSVPDADIPSSPPVPLTSTSYRPLSSSVMSGVSRKRQFSESELSSSPPSREADLPVQRVLSGSWWYNPDHKQTETGITSSMRLNEKLHAVKAETEIKRQSTSLAAGTTLISVGKQPQKPWATLPFRLSPQSYRAQTSPGVHTDDTIPQTPPPGYTDSMESPMSTPTNRNFKQLTVETSMKDASTDMSSGLPDEEEHGPPYSPISPKMGVFPIGSKNEQVLMTADAVEADTPKHPGYENIEPDVPDVVIDESKGTAVQQATIALPQTLEQSAIVQEEPKNEKQQKKEAPEIGAQKSETHSIPKDEIRCDPVPSSNFPRVYNEIHLGETGGERMEPCTISSHAGATPKEEKKPDEPHPKKRLLKKNEPLPPEQRRRSSRLSGSSRSRGLRPRAAPSVPRT